VQLNQGFRNVLNVVIRNGRLILTIFSSLTINEASISAHSAARSLIRVNREQLLIITCAPTGNHGIFGYGWHADVALPCSLSGKWKDVHVAWRCVRMIPSGDSFLSFCLFPFFLRWSARGKCTSSRRREEATVEVAFFD